MPSGSRCRSGRVRRTWWRGLTWFGRRCLRASPPVRHEAPDQVAPNCRLPPAQMPAAARMSPPHLLHCAARPIALRLTRNLAPHVSHCANTGSISLPRYRDDCPAAHADNGSGSAAASVLPQARASGNFSTTFFSAASAKVDIGGLVSGTDLATQPGLALRPRPGSRTR